MCKTSFAVLFGSGSGDRGSCENSNFFLWKPWDLPVYCSDVFSPSMRDFIRSLCRFTNAIDKEKKNGDYLCGSTPHFRARQGLIDVVRFYSLFLYFQYFQSLYHFAVEEAIQEPAEDSLSREDPSLLMNRCHHQ